MGWFNRLKLVNKILSPVLISAALTLTVGLYGLSVSKEMTANLTEGYTNNMLSLEYLANMRHALMAHARAELRLLTVRDPDDVQAVGGRSTYYWGEYERWSKKYAS